MADPSLEITELPPRPPGIEKEIYSIAILMTILPLIAIALRFYARKVKQTSLSWDDYMILPAMLGTIATAISMVIGTTIGDLGRHTHLIEIEGVVYPIFTQQTKIFQQIEYATLTTTILTFGFTKLAVLLFYKRIFQGALFNAACWTMIGLIFVWTVGFTFSQIFQCFPISLNWDPETQGGFSAGQCINVNKMFIAQAWSDVATNAVIILLPLGCIWELKMPFWKKVGVYSVFLLGALTVGFGVAKLVVYYRVLYRIEFDVEVLDLTFSQTPFVYWPMIESGVGIVGACLPLMRPLISGASSQGFVRRLRTFNATTPDNSDTFWKHSDNTALRDEWSNSVTTTNFGSASQAPTKIAGSVSTTELDPKSLPKKLGSLSAMKWSTESLPPVDPNHHYAGDIPLPRKGSAAVPMQQLSRPKLGVLDDDDLDDYPGAPRNPRRPRDMV